FQAIIGGLKHSALKPIAQTWASLPQETIKKLAELTEVVSTGANYAQYRKELSEAQGFKIPILGVHLKDLISLHVAYPDKIEKDLINFRKIAHLSIIFQELMALQTTPLPLEVNMDLVNTLRASLDIAYTEDEIYMWALAREPRNSSSPQTSPTRPHAFADWVQGVSPPDPTTIKEHIQAMVEAVFKNYDTDRDGYISQEEFRAIAGNFPFIDSFVVLDADQDGMISKDEMQRYFLDANLSHALRGSFKHSFHETTYFKPTFCYHCSGLLWGLLKQGFKCRDCGISAHKHCKNLLVSECRRSITGISSADFDRLDGKHRLFLRSKKPKPGEPGTSSSSRSHSSGRNVGTSSSSRKGSHSLPLLRLRRLSCRLPNGSCTRDDTPSSTLQRNSRAGACSPDHYTPTHTPHSLAATASLATTSCPPIRRNRSASGESTREEKAEEAADISQQSASSTGKGARPKDPKPGPNSALPISGPPSRREPDSPGDDSASSTPQKCLPPRNT
ncbi:unnamed protein product, partial [Cyprideis torosa]